jgi:O-antigen/teichoic acid export membrane protein
MPFRPQFHASEWWQLLRHTLAYAIAIAVNVAYFRIAIVVMSLLATERETGYFAASFRVLEVTLPIPALVIGAVFPILARAARDDRRRLAYASQRVFDVALIAGAGLVVAIEVAAPFIIEVLAGDDAEPAVGVLRIQAPALLATFVAVAGGFALLSLHRHRDLLLANFAPLIFSIALTILLVPPYGAEGAAISTTVAEWALAIVTVLLLRRAMEELELSFRAAGPALAAAAVACGVLLLPLPEVMQAALAPGVYVTVLFLLGGIPRELIDALPRRRAS